MSFERHKVLQLPLKKDGERITVHLVPPEMSRAHSALQLCDGRLPVWW